jgi:hypothetical protein
MIKIIFITLMSISYYNNDKEFLFVNPTESIRNKFNINSSIKNELEIINGEENITIKNYEHFLKFINLNYDKCSNNAKEDVLRYLKQCSSQPSSMKKQLLKTKNPFFHIDLIR